jgi:hypothetical protein
MGPHALKNRRKAAAVKTAHPRAAARERKKQSKVAFLPYDIAQGKKVTSTLRSFRDEAKRFA